MGYASDIKEAYPMKMLILVLPCFLFGGEITRIAVNKSQLATSVHVFFSSDTHVYYDPGFKIPVHVPKGFKKKYFFCPQITEVRSPHLPEAITDDSLFFIAQEIKKPVIGVMIVCAYDPEKVRFSWMKDILRTCYFFSYTILEPVVMILHDDHYRQYV